MRKKWAELTKYPGLFENVYWGWFVDKGNNPPDPGIVDNRNAFVVEHQITKCLVTYGRQRDQFLNGLERRKEFGHKGDHIELYRDAQGRFIILTSPYDRAPDYTTDPEIPKAMKALGFVIIPQLYSEATTTYMVKFDTVQSFKATAAAVGKEHSW